MKFPKIESLNHIAIEVKVLEPAIRFYRDILGLTELDAPAAAFEKGIRWFALPEGRMLHLVHVPETVPTRQGHFAMTVSNVQEWRNYLVSKGIEEIPATVAVYGAIDRLYFLDPSGNMLEFVKWENG